MSNDHICTFMTENFAVLNVRIGSKLKPLVAYPGQTWEEIVANFCKQHDIQGTLRLYVGGTILAPEPSADATTVLNQYRSYSSIIGAVVSSK